MVPSRLGMGVRQSGESPDVHSDRQSQPLRIAGRNLAFIRAAESRNLLDAGYRGRAVACLRLAACVVLD